MSGLQVAGTAAVSISMVIVATQAMAAIGEKHGDVVAIPSSDVDETLGARIDAAVAKRDVRTAVAEAFSALSAGFGEDGTSLSVKYFPKGDVDVAQSTDFTTGGGGCYANCHGACYGNCHTACHSACHGSRSWR